MADYDRILYADFSFPEASAWAIAAAAQLHGAPLPRAQGLRVLDLGCGCAGHLLGQAALDPTGHYVGIDQSRAQIEVGLADARRAGLANVTLHTGDVRALPSDLGRFDVIVCHGVFSWVPADVRRALLSAIRTHLTASGVALLSSNMSPGWRLRGTIREVLHRAIDPAMLPAERIAAARSLLAVWEAGAAAEPDPGARALAQELAALRNTDDAYLLYEHLAPLNQPIWFRDLWAAIRGSGLEFLGDASLTVHRPLDPGITTALHDHTQDPAAAEELRDVICNRAFRQSLLVHRERAFDTERHWRRLKGLWLHPRVRPEPDTADRYLRTDGAALRTADPLHRDLIAQLRARLPAATAFEELAPAAAPTRQRAAIGQAVLDLLYLGALLPLAQPPPVASTFPDRPLAPALTRTRAERTARVANLRHETHALTPAMRAVLGGCDGRTTVDTLVQGLAAGADAEPAETTGTRAVAPIPPDEARAAIETLWRSGFLQGDDVG